MSDDRQCMICDQRDDPATAIRFRVPDALIGVPFADMAFVGDDLSRSDALIYPRPTDATRPGDVSHYLRATLGDGHYCAWVEVDYATLREWSLARGAEVSGNGAAYATLRFSGTLANAIPERGMHVGTEVRCVVIEPAELPKIEAA